jgi:uncharacterized DUF497 family protein
MKQIITAIKRQLNNRVPQLEFIDTDLGQLFETPPTVKFPCALIDLQSAEYRNIVSGHQRGIAIIGVTVACRQIAHTSVRAPKRKEADQVYDLIDRVHEALQLFDNEQTFSEMIRMGLTKAVVNTSIESYTILYSVRFLIPYTGSNN